MQAFKSGVVRGVVAMLLLAASALAAAAEASAEQQKLAAEYFRVSGFEEMYSDPDKIYAMVESQMRSMDASITAQMPPDKAAEYRRQMTAVAPEMKRVILQAVQRMKPDMVAAVAKTYSVAELRALVDFYSSAIGRSIVAKNPALMDNMMAVSGARMGEMMQELQGVVANQVNSSRQPAAKPAKGK